MNAAASPADARAGGPWASVAVDVAVCTVVDGVFSVLLAAVRHGPFAGWWALPGGRVRADEPLDAAATRELSEQTGLRDIWIEQLYTFGHPSRDPQERVVSVAYVALTAHDDRFDHGAPATVPGNKYAGARWWPVADVPPLAYDHAAVVETAVTRLRSKLSYTNLAYTLMPPTFTLGELQAVYEAILGGRFDRRNFRKKLLSLGVLRSVGRLRRGPHRPAALYAFRRREPMPIATL